MVYRVQKDVDDPGQLAILDFLIFVRGEAAVKFAELFVRFFSGVGLLGRFAFGFGLLGDIEKR
ncbi:MAG: hypothetical protein GQ528_03340 [Woeseiaceae bacterium]|nr:hypothetical protein [Woeseiaceae bacterium]